jgi:5-methylcytosine-specific restriction protein A
MVSTSSLPDRHDPQQACEIFRELIPHAAQSAVATLLVGIIEHAHRAQPASWSASLFWDKMRINVGQVEVCTLVADCCHFIVALPFTDPDMPGIFFDTSRNPVYPAVPIPSGTIDVDLSQTPVVPEICLQPLLRFVGEAAHRKRGSPFKASFSLGFVMFLEEALGVTLPRPSYFADSRETILVPHTPEEVLSLTGLTEGAVRRIEVNAYERDARARRLCLEHHGCACAVCGMSFGAIYGEQLEGFIHVHHLRPLSEIRAEYEVNPIEDLCPVCPNCHAALHSRTPPLSLETLRAMIKVAGSSK